MSIVYRQNLRVESYEQYTYFSGYVDGVDDYGNKIQVAL